MVFEIMTYALKGFSRVYTEVYGTSIAMNEKLSGSTLVSGTSSVKQAQRLRGYIIPNILCLF